MSNVNGYVIYPHSLGVMDIDEAKRKARELSAREPEEPVRVEDCDTEKTVARYRAGKEEDE